MGEKQNHQLYFEKEHEQWDADAELKMKIGKNIEAEYSNNPSFEKYEEINYRTEIEFKKYIWGKGRVPSSLKSKLIFIHAKTFLYSLDSFEKQLKRFIKSGLVPEQCSSLHIKLLKDFPNLTELRNSAHHQEDRIRGEKYGKKIELKPVSNNFINAPNGGVLVINGLNGNNYGGTLGDGTYGEVEVSVRSMEKLQKILQDFINAFKW